MSLERCRAAPANSSRVYVAAVAISVGVAFPVAQSVRLSGFTDSLFIPLASAGIVYYLANTLLVSGILALKERKPLGKVWRLWFNWSFRYYLVGVATALIILASSRYVGWMFSLTLLPVMYMEYLFLKLNIRAQQSIAGRALRRM